MNYFATASRRFIRAKMIDPEMTQQIVKNIHTCHISALLQIMVPINNS